MWNLQRIAVLAGLCTLLLPAVPAADPSDVVTKVAPMAARTAAKAAAKAVKNEGDAPAAQPASPAASAEVKPAPPAPAAQPAQAVEQIEPQIVKAESAENAIVDKVVVRQLAEDKIPEELLIMVLRLRPGSEYKEAFLNEDVKSLYNTGRVSQVRGEVSPPVNGKVTVTYVVKPAPKISVFKITGNQKYSIKDLQGCLTIAEGERLSQKALSETLKKLREFYRSKGYMDAVIDPPQLLPDKAAGDPTVTVIITIKENLRLKVHSTSFKGNTIYSARELRDGLINVFSYWNWVPFVNDYLNFGLLDREELEKDKARLRDRYHEKGYLDFKVKEVKLIPVKDKPEYVDVVYELEEGKPYTVSAITVNNSPVTGKQMPAGITVLTPAEFSSRLVQRPNTVYCFSQNLTGRQNIINAYDARGYADVTVYPELKTDYENHKVVVNYEIREGRRYFVRQVDIVGNTATKDKVIRRELAIQPGDPVAKNRMDVSKRRLLGMGYFSKVEIDSVNADALDEKDIRVNVEEKPDRYNFRLGAGASDMNSVFGMAEISTDNFDIMNPKSFFYGGGQRLRLQGIYGYETAGLNLDFVEPWLLDLPLRFELSGFLHTSQFEDWDETRYGVRTGIQRKIFDDFTSINLGYKFEMVRVHNIVNQLKNYFKYHGLDGTDRVSQLSLALNRDTRDSLIDPTQGYMVNLFGALTPKALGSSNDYYRLEAKGSYHINFFDQAIVASIGGKLGVVSSFNTSDEVPVYERYFLGGGNSVRGFDYRSIGPTYRNKNIGGQTMMLMTAEVSHPIWGPLRGAVFADAGTTWANSYSVNFKDMNLGIGYGFRLKLPMFQAPLKLDLAYPVINNQQDASSKLRLHFNVGFTF